MNRPTRLSLLVLLPALALAVPLAVTGIETAAMRLPEDFAAAAERLPVAGYGGRNRGEFTVAAYGGQFTRIESRLAVFDPLYASNRGTASFSLTGPDLGSPVAADCEFRENVVTIGVVTFDPKKLAFVCDITAADPALSGRLILGEPRPEGIRQRLLTQAVRRGTAELGSVQIEIESVHQYANSRIQASAPVGYLLRHEATLVGALELTDVNPTLLLRQELPAPVRQSTLIAALAVSLLRDPANSSLGD